MLAEIQKIMHDIVKTWVTRKTPAGAGARGDQLVLTAAWASVRE